MMVFKIILWLGRLGTWWLLVENHWLWRELLLFSYRKRKLLRYGGWQDEEKEGFGKGVMADPLALVRLNDLIEGDIERGIGKNWKSYDSMRLGWTSWSKARVTELFRGCVLSDPLLHTHTHTQCSTGDQMQLHFTKHRQWCKPWQDDKGRRNWEDLLFGTYNLPWPPLSKLGTS